MCFVLNSMHLQWIRHDLSMHLMNLGSLGTSSLWLRVTLAFVAMALPRLLNVPGFLPLGHWITTELWGPICPMCPCCGCWSYFAESEVFFSVFLIFFPFLICQPNIHWNDLMSAAVVSDHITTSTALTLTCETIL